jgi:uncharacterized damage-inducible protein DinB
LRGNDQMIEVRRSGRYTHRMDLDDLRTLLDYHYWARDRVLAAADLLTPGQYLKELGSSFPSIRDTLVHTYSSECVWHSRWVGTPLAPHLPSSDYPDVGSLRAAWTKHETLMRTFVVTQGDQGIDQAFHYQQFNGVASASRFCDMLQHLVNHGTYHRGQVTTMLRQLGAAPPKSMDLIAFYRERSSAAPQA